MNTRNARSSALLVGSAVVVLASGCVGTAPVRPEIAPADRVQMGYGSQAKEDVTGAVSSVTAEQMKDVRVGRVEELLEGRVAGVQVVRGSRGEMSLRIRGTRSLLRGNEPLIVVDGMALSPGALSAIAPGTVARIDVLKDAGSTAAYGARGANGVIVISTKRAWR